MTTDQKIALVDLERCHTEIFPVSADLEKRFLGGRGIGTYLFCQHATEMCDPGSAENICVVSAGYLSGTLSAPHGTVVLTSKSKSTGLMARTSLISPFAAEMRQAGFEHLVLKGRAKSQIFLLIRDGRIELKAASGLEGKNNFEQRTILCDAGASSETRCLGIQKKGADSVFISDACLPPNMKPRMVSDPTGVGAVLASKNIVAFACRGTLGLEVKDPEGIINYEKKQQERDVNTPSVESGRGGGTIDGPVGSVDVLEMKQTIACCLGLPFETQTGETDLNFQTAAARVVLNTGLAVDEDELKDIAYRCIAVERLYNLREGIAEKGGELSEDYQKNGWTRKALVEKDKVFYRLWIGDLWDQLKS